MTKQVTYQVPATENAREYFERLWTVLWNEPLEVSFSARTLRQLFKQAYPKAKV